MRKSSIALAVGLMLAGPVLAESWHYEGGATPIAYIDNGPAQFQFACRGGQLAMGFWVRAPEASVASASALSLAITPDPAKGSTVSAGSAATLFAQDMPLIHLEGSSAIVRGPVARQWARIAQGAGTELRVAFVRQAGSGLEVFDSQVFGAKGSKSTIGQVLGKCS
ncbi:hypothetical protein [Devosia beringensis]|uniref:hypothetical protein n=1 Tax=Devosia beringensis TaxID=2657486 RepID=UPI00186B8BFE|nr:hypothetical protein [Devosia beringensis]